MDLDVFNMSKTSNMYILNIFLKRYCTVWVEIVKNAFRTYLTEWWLFDIIFKRF